MLTFFNKVHKLSVLGLRHISIKSAFPVKNQENTVCSIILATGNDQNHEENRLTYVSRSYSELFKSIPKVYKGQPLIMAKIQASVVKPSSNDVMPQPIFTGHIIVGLGYIDDYSFNFYENAVISKVTTTNEYGSYFETPKKVLEDALISTKTREDLIKEHCSQEFFTFTLLDKTLLTLEGFQTEQLKLLIENNPHDLSTSSCIHAAYKGLTGRNHEPNVSTQRGYMRASLEILPSNDRILENSLRNSFFSSGLAKTGYIRGMEYLNKQTSPKPY